MKRSLGVAVFAALLIAGVCVMLGVINPAARRHLDTIEAEITEGIPIGSSLQHTQATLKSRYGREGDIRFPGKEKTKLLTFRYGSFYEARNFPFRSSIRAYWYFDADDKIEKFQIGGQVDGP